MRVRTFRKTAELILYIEAPSTTSLLSHPHDIDTQAEPNAEEDERTLNASVRVVLTIATDLGSPIPHAQDALGLPLPPLPPEAGGV